MDVGTRVDYLRKVHHDFLLIGDTYLIFPIIAYKRESQPSPGGVQNGTDIRFPLF